MSPALWRQIEPVLDQALDLPPAEWGAFLDQACAGDAALRAAVEALLTADQRAAGFLATPAGEYAADLLAADGPEDGTEADLAGRQVGPYRLRHVVGGGGMGVVYEAEDTRLGRRVAIKLLPPEVSRDRRAKERFLREARAASALDHPNICTLHDVGESDGRLYIVLALYEGETLRERLERGPLPPAEAREVAIQVARGLAHAHAAGITHRDVKPSNVMLTRRGEVKILDFGIAKLDSDISLTQPWGPWGTPSYMSPEQARGEPVDGRTDVWSLGVMLYEMIAGRRPFGGESMQVVLSAILTREPEPLERLRPELPPELVRVVAKALAKDRGERYASAAALLADLESGTAPAVASPAPRPRRRVTARGVGLLASALAAAGLLAVAVRSLPPFAAEPPGSAGVRPQDRAMYLGLQRRADGGERLGPEELARLDALLKTSPELVGAYLLAANIAAGLGKFDRGLAYAQRAQVLSPDDPKPLFSRFRVEMVAGRLDAARDTRRRLQEMAPADASVQIAEADLLEARGDLEAARLAREKVARRSTDWRRVVELATVEIRLGQVDSARNRLEKLLAVQPHNQVVRENLAFLEAQLGDLQRAAALYEELVAVRPAREYLSTLGFLHYVLGDYRAAAAVYGQALALGPDEPGNVLTRFNLAAAVEAGGDVVAARRLYDRLAQELAAAPGAPEARIRMLHAHCLVRLGRHEEASRLGEQALKQRPDDIQVLFLAAQLHALLGDPNPTVYYAERALKKGLRWEWFTIPEFHSLADDPDFRALLDSHATRKPAA